MKLLSSIFYFSLLFSFTYQDAISDLIDGLIDKVRDTLPEEIAIDKLDVDLPDNKYATGYANVSDFKLKGLKEFTADIKKGFLFPNYFLLGVDTISLDLNYISDVKILNTSLLSIFGQGKASVVLKNFTVEGNINVSISFSGTNMSIYGLTMHLDDGKFAIDGLLDDELNFSDELSDLLSNNVANLFNANENILSSVIQEEINKVLADFINNSTLATSLEEMENDEYFIANDILETYNVEENLFKVPGLLLEAITTELLKTSNE